MMKSNVYIKLDRFGNFKFHRFLSEGLIDKIFSITHFVLNTYRFSYFLAKACRKKNCIKNRVLGIEGLIEPNKFVQESIISYHSEVPVPVTTGYFRD